MRKAGGVIISDEIQTGLGRLGEAFWGFQLKNNDIIPDIVLTAKGLGNGTFPIGAMIVRSSIAEKFAKGKFFMSTMSCHPTAAVVGREVLRIIEEEKT